MTNVKHFPKTISQLEFDYSLFTNLPRFVKFTDELSYLSWRNTYPNSETTCHIKLTFFLSTKLLKNLLFAKYFISVTAPLTRLSLGFRHLSEHKFGHNFADSLNPLCSCSSETESTLHFFLRCQNYTTLRKALMTDFKNINDAIMSLNESDLLHVMLYGNKYFDNNMNIIILTATIKLLY